MFSILITIPLALPLMKQSLYQQTMDGNGIDVDGRAIDCFVGGWLSAPRRIPLTLIAHSLTSQRFS